MKNRILFISRTLTGGGAERFVATFSSYLAEKGYNISLLLYERSNIEYSLSNKVNIYVMPTTNGKLKKTSRVFSMRKILKIINPDVIIPFIDTVLLCSFLAQYGLNTKFIFTVRNSPWDEVENFKVRLLKSMMIKHADYIMLQNEEQAEYFNPYLKNKEIIIPNPVSKIFVNSPKQIYANKIQNIIFVGRLEPQKNIPLLLTVFKNIIENNPNLILKIFGKGSEESALQHMISKLGIENNCFLCGRSNSIEKELINSDLFILPSNYEGMPNSLIEAMAVGVPCISSDCRTGPKSLIKPYESGLLFHVNNEKDLKDKLEWALNNSEQMEIYGKNGRKYICDNFTLEKIESKFRNIIVH